MPNTINAASPAESEAHIFGSGALQWDWWVRLARDWEYREEGPLDPPADWMWKVTAEHPTEDDATITKEIRHSDVMTAARTIMNATDTYPEQLRKECRNLLFDVDECDLDAADADCVLQVAMYGEVVFG